MKVESINPSGSATQRQETQQKKKQKKRPDAFQAKAKEGKVDIKV
ncbi:MAG: hypothetical protein N2257_00425 [Thermodesulfovibrionales bacterium]|nr:hypothetical protein [Thermodesulfovibrionales bacterium]